MDYLKRLVEGGILPRQAVELAQEERDPPWFGIGLRER